MHYPIKVIIGLFAATLCLSGHVGGVQAEAPEKSKTTTTPPPGGVPGGTVARAATADVQHGKTLFKENCEACHQEEGRGKPGFAPSLTNPELLTAASDRFLTATIREGRAPTPMPPFGEILKASDIQDIIGYLRSYSQASVIGDQLDASPPGMGDPHLGKRLFAQICAGCHGPNGEGYESSGSGTAIGKPGFLSKASAGFIRYIILHGRSNTPMRGFSGPGGLANLTNEEVDGLVAYLRSLRN
ncbi:MAG: c-type cytochrome [Magnetococcales bacterium]|nr:c-type cytochrome [Magnetococcales bacterium]